MSKEKVITYEDAVAILEDATLCCDERTTAIWLYSEGSADEFVLMDVSFTELKDIHISKDAHTFSMTERMLVITKKANNKWLGLTILDTANPATILKKQTTTK